MQNLFMNSTFDLEKISRKHNKKINLASETLLKEIIEFQGITKDEQDKCFKKIVIDIILRNKLGKPGNPKVKYN